MSIQHHLNNAQKLVDEKHYEEAISECKYVLDIEPDNPEALSLLDKLQGATPLRRNCNLEDQVPRIKTNFFVRQASDISAPITQGWPVRVVLLLLFGGIAWAIYQGAMYVINFDKLTAMKNVEVHLEKPTQKEGFAYVNVLINNFNPAPVSDTTFSYTISGSVGAPLTAGKVTITTPVPAGDSRTFPSVKLEAISHQAGRLHAELVDLKYGPKPNLSLELANKFREAASLKDKEAVGAFKEMVKSNGDFSPAYVGLGQALAANDELDLAIKAYQKALSINPQDANAHYNLGVALFYKADKQGAHKEFDQAHNIVPDDPSVIAGLKELATLGDKVKPTPNVTELAP